MKTKLPDLAQIEQSEIQLLRLKRNQRDIARCYGKLRSYVCEPRTHEQFLSLNLLRETAEQLRDANQQIICSLKMNVDALVSNTKMLDAHLQNSAAFREDTIHYLSTVNSHYSESV